MDHSNPYLDPATIAIEQHLPTATATAVLALAWEVSQLREAVTRVGSDVGGVHGAIVEVTDAIKTAGR